MKTESKTARTSWLDKALPEHIRVYALHTAGDPTLRKTAALSVTFHDTRFPLTFGCFEPLIRCALPYVEVAYSRDEWLPVITDVAGVGARRVKLREHQQGLVSTALATLEKLASKRRRLDRKLCKEKARVEKLGNLHGEFLERVITFEPMNECRTSCTAKILYNGKEIGVEDSRFPSVMSFYVWYHLDGVEDAFPSLEDLVEAYHAREGLTYG